MFPRLRRYRLIALVALVLLVAGACSDDATESPAPDDTTNDNPVIGDTTGDSAEPDESTGGDPALAADMIRLDGTVTDGTFDAAFDGPIAGPFTLQVPSAGGGNGAVINPVSVDGVTKSIVWDGGRPLSLDGPDLTLDGRWVVGGGALAFDLASNVAPLPAGTYSLVGPVAVGDPSGLATPADQVTFVAGPETGILGTGQSSLIVPADGVLLGPGSLNLHGTFTVTTATETVTASSIVLESGSFELTISGGDAVSVSGLAQGAGWS